MLWSALVSSSVIWSMRLPCPAPIISACHALQDPLANYGFDRAARFDHMFLKLRQPFSAAPAQATMFKLAHISDPHLGPLPPVRVAELLNKRFFGWLSWVRRRRALHRPEVLAALADRKSTRLNSSP